MKKRGLLWAFVPGEGKREKKSVNSEAKLGYRFWGFQARGKKGSAGVTGTGRGRGGKSKLKKRRASLFSISIVLAKGGKEGLVAGGGGEKKKKKNRFWRSRKGPARPST